MDRFRYFSLKTKMKTFIKSSCFKWTYWCSGIDYRGASLFTRYLTAKGKIPSVRTDRRTDDPNCRKTLFLTKTTEDQLSKVTLKYKTPPGNDTGYLILHSNKLFLCLIEEKKIITVPCNLIFSFNLLDLLI